MTTDDAAMVSLWHLYQKDTTETLFWDATTAPLLKESPEFLHTRMTAPSGIAYEMDVTVDDTITMTAMDVSGATSIVMDPDTADLYYFFLDDTKEILEAAFLETPPEGVTVSIVKAGTLLDVHDKSYTLLNLQLELPAPAILITLGAGTILDDMPFSIKVQYERTLKDGVLYSDAASLFEDEAAEQEQADSMLNDSEATTRTALLTIASLAATAWLCL